MATAKFNYQKLYDELNRWLNDEYSIETFKNDARGQIGEQLKKGGEFTSIRALEEQSDWNLVEAIVINQNDLNVANNAFVNSIEWRICSLEIKSIWIKTRPKVDLGFLNDACMRLAMAIIAGLKESAGILASFITRGLNQNLMLEINSKPLAKFLLEIDSRWRGIPSHETEYTLEPKNVYSQVIVSIDSRDITSLIQSLRNICYYHVERSLNSSSRETYEFDSYAYRIYPAEVIAAMKVCDSMDLPLLDFSHPVVDTPLLQLGAPEKKLIDPLLQKVKGKLDL